MSTSTLYLGPFLPIFTAIHASLETPLLPTLSVRLLGEFHLSLDDQPIDLLSRQRQQSLLAYLLLHRNEPQSRQQIAFVFWPDSSERQSFTNLRKLLFQLRQTLPEPDRYLDVTTYSVGWRRNAPLRLDVADVEQALANLEKNTAPVAETLEQVITCYRGELLPNCYEDWILPIRRALHARVVNTLAHALVELEKQHEYSIGLRVAEYLLRLDPLKEATYRQLMQLRAMSGDRAAALLAYHNCVKELEQELGVSPATETQALYQRLLRSESPTAPAPTGVSVLQKADVPLVGRGQEWLVLRQAWQELGSRGPQLVTVTGEAGVGKTRLVEELMRWANLRPGTVVYARAYAAEGAFSYAPLTEWLRNETMRQGVAELPSLWQTEIARLLPDLLIDQPKLTPPAPMREGWQQQRFHEALARAVLAAPEPRLLILDDLQWCDAETLHWLEYLLRFEPQALLLVVGTVRSDALDDTHPLHDLRRHLRREAQWYGLELARLSVEETGVLAGHLTDQDVAPWLVELYQETEGNPLFIVETMRAGLVGKQRDPHGMPKLPDSVQAVISTRLAQLSAETRQLAQFAAVVGRQFTLDVIMTASEMERTAVVEGLDELWHRNLVREQADGYDFTHDKLREVIVQEMSPMRRRYLHARVAQALEGLNAQRLPEFAGQLAVHHGQAGNYLRAATYALEAAEAAHQLLANQDAVRHLRHGLELVELLPSTDESQAIWLELLTYLAFLLMETQGTASAEVMHIYEKARTYGPKWASVPSSFALLHAMTASHRVHADFGAALELADQLLHLAHQGEDGQQLAAAHFQLGAICFATGELVQARTHFESSAQLCPVQRANTRPHSWLGETLLLLGAVDQALMKIPESLSPLDYHTSPYDFVATLGDTLELRLVAGVSENVEQDIARLVEIVHRYHFTQHETWSRFLQGWWLASSKGLPMAERMESGVRDFQKIGGRSRLSRFLGLVAEQYFRHGEKKKAEVIWQEAMHHVEQHNERFWEAELCRLRGEMLLTEKDYVQAERWLRRALDTARGQQATLLELRAAASLSRLWHQLNRQHAAVVLLSDVYGRFVEGFDAPDLQSAQALLESLEYSLNPEG